ncbi:MAG: hypothetical protein JWO31_1081, partial [Phycisphaerales bacterium]|nr:hypothetical protein [Phycisphaerales bacterium]
MRAHLLAAACPTVVATVLLMLPPGLAAGA